MKIAMLKRITIVIYCNRAESLNKFTDNEKVLIEFKYNWKKF